MRNDLIEACPFCEIISREDPDAREIYRDSDVVAFFPTEPATLGHTLIVPRRHAPDIWDLKDNEAEKIATATLKVANAINRALNPEGLNIIQSNGAAATQTVFHLHVHLVPRWAEDDLGRIWPPETNYSAREKDLTLEKLKKEIKRSNG